MTKRNYKLFIEDILECINKIENYIKDFNFHKFEKNSLIIDAVIRNLEIIGEAARNVPEIIKEKHDNIPWKRMIGLRNITVHEYFGVDLSIIWEIITKNLPETKNEIEKTINNF